jgi:hypothetical protein
MLVFIRLGTNHESCLSNMTASPRFHGLLVVKDLVAINTSNVNSIIPRSNFTFS